MKNSKRALRRHHYQRLKGVRRLYWGGIDVTDKGRLGSCVSNPKVCSCFGCGNRRKYDGQSLAEKRFSISCL